MRIKLINRLKSLTYADVTMLFIIAVIFFALVSFLVFPLCSMIIKSFQDKDGQFVWFAQFAKYLNSPAMVSSLLNTVYIAVVSTVISVSLAFVFAFCLSRRNVAGRHFFRFIAMLPILAPTMMHGICLIYIFGNQGLLTKAGFVIDLYGSVGIIIAESVFCFPVAFMILAIAFSASDNRLYEAADVMGTNALRKMLTITLPNVKYGLISSIFVCFTYSFTDFGAPSIVGGNFNVLATDIYKQVVGQQNFNIGAVVGLVMMIPTVICFFIDRFVSGKQIAVSSKAMPYKAQPDKLYDSLALGFCTIVSMLLLAFFAVALFASLVKMWPYNLSLTFQNYDFSKAAGGSANVIKNSVIISLLTAVIGAVFAFMAAYITEKTRLLPRIRRAVYFMSIAPTAIPGTVVGLAYILFFNPRTFPIPGTNLAIVNLFNGLYGSIWILVIVNIIHYFSVPFLTAMTALKNLDKEYEIVSESLSVPYYRTLLRVTAPMSFRAIVEIVVYFFVNSMITISAVIFLYTPATRPASVTILNIRDAGDIAIAAAMSMLIFGVNIVARLAYEFVNSRLSSRLDAWKVRS